MIVKQSVKWDSRISEELDQNLSVALVGLETLKVIFRCKFAQRWETVPRNGREVVVLNMVTNVQAEGVDGGINRVGRLSLLDEVVLLDLSHAKWMQSIHETSSKELIHEELPAEEVNNTNIVQEAAQDVECEPTVDGLRESVVRNKGEFGWVKRASKTQESQWNGDQHHKSQDRGGNSQDKVDEEDEESSQNNFLDERVRLRTISNAFVNDNIVVPHVFIHPEGSERTQEDREERKDCDEFVNISFLGNQSVGSFMTNNLQNERHPSSDCVRS